jgi:dolichol-phosphate mannosyltransferase
MYNEERGAELCVRSVCEELRRLPNRCTLISVNDGSRDRTGEILASLASHEDRLTVVNHACNSGYGAALRTGVERAAEAGYNYVLFMDSDLTNHPQDIPRFVAKMEEGIDVIKATRYSHGGGFSGVPFYRVAISACGNWLASLLYGLPVQDCTNGFRAGKVNILMRMKLTEKTFPIIMEELYWSKFLARSFAEVPVLLTSRTGDLRTSSFTYKPKIFYDYLKYPIRARLGIRPSPKIGIVEKPI